MQCTLVNSVVFFTLKKKEAHITLKDEKPIIRL